MRHLVKTKRIGKDSKHKRAILRNLSRALISRERVLTTIAKGRLLRGFIEKLITRAKTNTLHNRRIVYKDLYDASLLTKLFDNIAKRYESRPGGYTRIIKVGMRKGDGSEMCYVEFVPELLRDTDKTTSSKAPAKKDERSPAAQKDHKKSNVDPKNKLAESTQKPKNDKNGKNAKNLKAVK
ncbi:50S ribosomal protein L17 [Spirochaetota bacterium]|nr:50S ribosomal protein L17 [Spirochaetota bacterium]